MEEEAYCVFNCFLCTPPSGSRTYGNTMAIDSTEPAGARALSTGGHGVSRTQEAALNKQQQGDVSCCSEEEEEEEEGEEEEEEEEEEGNRGITDREQESAVHEPSRKRHEQERRSIPPPETLNMSVTCEINIIKTQHGEAEIIVQSNAEDFTASATAFC
ncbi:microtubule-associated protein RP/EB family member 1 [Pleuronectes platessa]|uniref:microtubule-associated protein RP/EB family member 1 n=1 Tax=Pleuronectes platessa TaxID=8262 RepID=UPI00232A3994|nr:microtubule-associated protein RP/EB family member 1 [Pleuronectes platessa]